MLAPLENLVHMRLRPTNEVGVRYAKPEDLAPAVPLLDKSLSDPDSEVRDNAALALAYADPGDKRAAPILAQIWIAVPALKRLQRCGTWAATRKGASRLWNESWPASRLDWNSIVT